MNPRRLAAELGEIHAAIRDAVAAYDPRLFAAEIDATLDEIAVSLRALSPAALLGDIDFLGDVVALVENAVPSAALEGVGDLLTEIGATIRGLDLAALVDAVEALGPRVIESFEDVVAAIRNELLALLELLRFSSGSASASVSVSASAYGMSWRVPGTTCEAQRGAGRDRPAAPPDDRRARLRVARCRRHPPVRWRRDDVRAGDRRDAFPEGQRRRPVVDRGLPHG